MKKLKGLSEEERQILKQAIYEDAECLAEEMNLRLLCDAPNGAETILWVESVSVTDICYIPRKRKRKIMAIIYKLFKRKKE